MKLSPKRLLASVLLLTFLLMAYSLASATIVSLAWDYDPTTVPTTTTFTGFRLQWKLDVGTYTSLPVLPAASRTFTHTFPNPLNLPVCYMLFAQGTSAGQAVESTPATGSDGTTTEVCVIPPPIPVKPLPPTNLTAFTGVVLQGAQLVVFSVDSEETVGAANAGINAIDGKPLTFWHSQWSAAQPPLPHTIILDLGQTYPVMGWSYLSRQDGGTNGDIANYQIFVATSPTTFPATPTSIGTFTGGKTQKHATWTPALGRYVKIVALTGVSGDPRWTNAAEIGIYVLK